MIIVIYLEKQPIGVMIVVNQEGFETRGYRKFNIKFNNLKIEKSKSNDYYMLEEVLKRRLLRTDNDHWIIPDLIVIDGGKGHLNIAKNILDKTNNNIDLIAVAKGKNRNIGREIIYYNKTYKVLKKSDDMLFFIQRIRDEAHRFAIYSHRKKRGKELVKSIFSEIQGIGPKKKKNFIRTFRKCRKYKSS